MDGSADPLSAVTAAPGRTATWIAAAAAAGVALATALPWARSGRRPLSGYDLIGVARRFELATGPAARAGAALVLGLPVLAALALVFATLGRRGGAAATAAVVGAIGLVASGWVAKIAQGSSAHGVRVTIVTSSCCLGGAAAGLVRIFAQRSRRT